ncbi:DNA cytosine methyltransferase [Mycobacteroides abscessus]|uniref:DNA (cytosine-5-)-methyltransferase n=1 Tax=Mycobacteroides abscessus TaxID=36809 RepID=A0A0U0ZMK5_9MYCO|nr:DNA cytosine methyltransferase [Mycobacteroides abscessus]MBL3737089.1 DNA cytosine methyltransferase [Mycobacteroides abscessus subsp. massiliense]MBL3744220.1 DNA cytosine methyltransferase [Mycobacteroides abscessus subsp. massiliense]MBL3761356.1 DNA cytosine methyltransferase [Mycobacteroides abscessus subsp. massiliense]MBN7483115.1 DNA cytosine methyltransferase [Mycobacteroides abscessus subsp. massiliense]MDB2213584.1 DNA cytosine methyltransferase [Mycobacteroides abscessus subsp.
MLAPRIGSLFSGAGGLDLAVEHVTGGRTVWHCEADPDAAKVLAAHWPGVPNLGDITAVDWSAIEPVDVLCGGFPCQDVSAAGRRAGIASGTRSGLWLEYAEAINQLRPQLVVIENVRGLLSGYAHRAMEPGPDDLGDRSSRPLLRAAGAVLGDLADLGYDAQWTTVAASDIGAPHRRERVFIVAYPAGSGRPDEQKCSNAQGLDVVAESGPSNRDSARGTATGIHQLGRGSRELAAVDLLPTPTASRYASNQSPSPGAAVRPGLDSIMDLLPTPAARDHKGPADPNREGGHDLYSALALLPTPAASDGARGPDYARVGRDGSGGDDLITTVFRTLALLPTPSACDASGGGQSLDKRQGHTRQLVDYALLDGTPQWGKYEPAIRRWEAITREAPSPTEPGAKGNPRLAARFSEWMQGWPLGWVTAVPISRSAMLRIIGNGVVPQQAVAALCWLLSVCEVAA